VAVSEPNVAQLKWSAKPAGQGGVQPASAVQATTVAQEPREQH
jgi:hypothetical protein